MNVFAFFLIVAILFIPITLVYAQHHGGEQAPPVHFGSGEVTVTTSLFPADFVPNDTSGVNLKIRFFDTKTNMNIESVSYRVQIFYGTQLVANQMFFDRDGDLEIKVQPKLACDQEDLWKCTKYFGDKDPIVPNALTSSPSSIPVISGPVFVKSGQYTVKTDIIGAKNPKTTTSEDIHFETLLTIPSSNQFQIESMGTKYTITTKDFQNPISDLNYDESSKTISLRIPFDWNHLEHFEYVKNSLEIPKNFLPYINMNSFSGKVNGVSIFPKDLHFDKISNKNFDVLHLMMDIDGLKQLKDSNSYLTVELTPENSLLVMNKEINFDNGFRAVVSYDSRLSPSGDFLFSIAFYDSQGNLIPNIRYGYGIKDPTGKEIANIGGNPKLLGLNLPNGVDTRLIDASYEGKYLFQIVILGIMEKDFEKKLFETFEFEMKKPKISNDSIPIKLDIPSWIKNNAGWWAAGSIDDKSFVQGIQFLINEKIINIPSTSEVKSNVSKDIPSWIKNNAGWWAAGSIDDKSFVQGIQFLIQQGILRT